MNYKYCILEKLERLTHRDYQRLIKEIPKALGKTRKTFDRYCTLEIGEYGDVFASDLAIIAYYLDCTSEELKNYEVVNGKIQLKKSKYLKSS